MMFWVVSMVLLCSCYGVLSVFITLLCGFKGVTIGCSGFAVAMVFRLFVSVLLSGF